MRASRPVPVPIDSATFQLPLIATPRATGFPQATADYEEVGIDFNRLLYRHPAATYIMRVARDGMNGSDLLANDLVIIDAALTPQPGDLVVAQVEDTFLLCRFERQEGSIVLIPENTGYQPLSVTAETAPLALVDVNNCYVSCERIFQPSLQRRGVLVVGSNDGNIVARSDEVRALGIPMGAPLFEYEALIKQHHIAVCSANWALYGGISARVMATLAQFTSELEVYSVDEAWLTLPTLNPSELCAFASDIRATIRQYVKLPASVGVAPTKTLAKAANKHAKKTASGVLVLQEEVEIDALLATMPVEDVWMIGPHRAVCLAEQHIRTALDLKHAPEQWVKQRLSVVGLRAVLELRGIPCIPLTDVPPAKQQIACGQAFGQPVEDLASLKEAIASYMVRAAERLRSQHSKAGHVTVYLHTNPFRLAQPQYARSGGCTLAEPTSATGSLITAAHQLLARLFRPGYQYHRAGVFLQGLVSDTPTQLSLFSTPEQQAKQQAVYTAVDAIFPVIEHINKLEGYPVFFLLAKPIEACRHGIY